MCLLQRSHPQVRTLPFRDAMDVTNIMSISPSRLVPPLTYLIPLPPWSNGYCGPITISDSYAITALPRQFHHSRPWGLPGCARSMSPLLGRLGLPFHSDKCMSPTTCLVSQEKCTATLELLQRWAIKRSCNLWLVPYITWTTSSVLFVCAVIRFGSTSPFEVAAYRHWPASYNPSHQLRRTRASC